MQSIISIIKKEGIYSEKIQKINANTEILDEPIFENKKYKLIDVIDNRLEPSKSISNKCKFCNGTIKYEHHLLDKTTNKCYSIGADCACECLNIYDFKTKAVYDSLTTTYLKIKQWKQRHKTTYENLEALSKLDHPFYNPFVNAIKRQELSNEDIDVIDSANIKALKNDAEYIVLLMRLNDMESLKQSDSNTVHSLVDRINTGKYLSESQRKLIKAIYSKNNPSYYIAIKNAYKFIEALKNDKYKYNEVFKVWYKVIQQDELQTEKTTLAIYGIKKEQIEISPKYD